MAAIKKYHYSWRLKTITKSTTGNAIKWAGDFWANFTGIWGRNKAIPLNKPTFGIGFRDGYIR